MLREFHDNDRISWPGDKRITVSSEIARWCCDELFKPERNVAAS